MLPSAAQGTRLLGGGICLFFTADWGIVNTSEAEDSCFLVYS